MNNLSELPRYDWSEPPLSSQTSPLSAIEMTPMAWEIIQNRFPDIATDADKLSAFINPELKTITKPFDFPLVKDACQTIKTYIDNGGEITIFGDFDCDGVTATAILSETIMGLGGKVRTFIPLREEGYGLSEKAVARCLEDGVPSLLITVDCGINARQSLERLQSLGTEVIVTDHHLPDEEEKTPWIVIAPHLKGVPPQCRNLCGAGVAFKIASGLIALFYPAKDEKGIQKRRELFSWLDALSVATVADVVPLTGENRTIVSLGLQALNNRPATGLKELIRLLLPSIPNNGITITHIGFILAPHINSAGRIKSAEDALYLLQCATQDEAKKYAVRLKQTNAERRTENDKVAKNAFEILDSSQFNPNCDGAIVIAGENWHSGIIGLVASKISEKYQRPAAVITIINGKECRGSIRAPLGYNVHAALKGCSDLLLGFGGHEQAAGFSIAREKIDEFRTRFASLSFAQAGAAYVRPSLNVEKWLDATSLDYSIIESLKTLAPFGEGNGEPVFGIRNAIIKAVTIGKAKVVGLGLEITTADGLQLRGVWFGGQEYKDQLNSGRWDIAGTISENTYMGDSRLQMQIIDVRRATWCG